MAVTDETYDDEVSARDHALALADALLDLARTVGEMLAEVGPDHIGPTWFTRLSDSHRAVTEQVVWQGLEL